MRLKAGPLLVMTPDLDEALVFYRDLLGLPPLHMSDSQLTFDAGRTSLHVFRCSQPAPPAEHGSGAASVITFEVDQLAEAMAAFAARGVRFLHTEPNVNLAAGLRYAAFHAPGGNFHELVERI